MIKFFQRLKEGFALGAQKDFARSYNRICDILENLDGAPFSGIKVKRVGDQWRIHYDGSQDSGAASLFTFPWQVLITGWDETAGDTVEVRVGRVFEADAADTSMATLELDTSFRELVNEASYLPGDILTSVLPPASSDDYLVISNARKSNGTLSAYYNIDWEANVSSGHLYRRIAKYTAGSGGRGTIEQIAMGDVWRAQRRLAPFSVANVDDRLIMYVPQQSVVANGVDLTGSRTGLTAAGFTDWYELTALGTGTVSAYILMSYNDGEYGKPSSAEFGTAAPTWDGEIIAVPLIDLETASGNVHNIAHGAIDMEIVRPDGNSSGSKFKSIAKPSTDGAFTDENHTVGLHGFGSATAPQEDPFCEDLTCFSHHFALRESDSTCADLRWLSAACLAEGIGDYLENVCSWVPDGGEFCLNTEFETWYDGLAKGLFWERGADYTINYGSSIGDMCEAERIRIGTANDLVQGYLLGYWEFDSMCGCHVCSNSIGSTCLYAACFDVTDIQLNGLFNGYTLEFCTTDGLIHFT